MYFQLNIYRYKMTYVYFQFKLANKLAKLFAFGYAHIKILAVAVTSF